MIQLGSWIVLIVVEEVLQFQQETLVTTQK